MMNKVMSLQVGDLTLYHKTEKKPLFKHKKSAVYACLGYFTIG